MQHTPVLPEPATSRVSKDPDLLGKILSALGLAALIIYAVVGAVSVNENSIKLLSDPLDTTLPEGANAYTALRAGTTGQLYISYNQTPHVEQPFGPLFYAFTAATARLSRLDLDLTVRHIREVTYACYVLSALMVFLISRKLGCSVGLAALAAILMLAQPDFLGWNVTVRPDLISLLFMLLSLYFSLGLEEHRWLFVSLSGFFAGLAFLFKQPGAAVAVAILLLMLWRKQFLKMVLFCAAFAVPILLMFSFLILRREPFWEQFSSIGNASWSLGEGVHFFLSVIASDIIYLVPIGIGLLGLVGCFKTDKASQLVASFLVITGLTGLFGLPQIGSNTNYLLPALAGCSLVLPAALELFRRQPKLRFASLLIAPALIYAAHSGYLHNAGYLRFYGGPANISFAPVQPLRMLTDIPLLTLRGRDPEFLDGFSTHSLELTGHFRSAPIVQEIQQSRFDVVVFRSLMPHVVFYPRPKGYREVASWRGISEFSPEIVSALNQNYTVLCSGLYSSAVLKPNNRPLNVSASYFTELLGEPCKTGAAGHPPDLVVADKAR